MLKNVYASYQHLIDMLIKEQQSQVLSKEEQGVSDAVRIHQTYQLRCKQLVEKIAEKETDHQSFKERVSAKQNEILKVHLDELERVKNELEKTKRDTKEKITRMEKELKETRTRISDISEYVFGMTEVDHAYVWNLNVSIDLSLQEKINYLCSLVDEKRSQVG